MPVPENYPNWPLEKVDVIHFGINGEILSNYYEIKFGRRTSVNDSFQYKISIGKEIKNSLDVKLFLANDSRKIGTGFVISRSF